VSGEQHHGDAELFPRVAATTVHKRWWVSTIRMPHDLSTKGIPLYYETCVFDMAHDNEEMMHIRYPTKAAAERGHRRIVGYIRKEGKPPS